MSLALKKLLISVRIEPVTAARHKGKYVIDFNNEVDSASSNTNVKFRVIFTSAGRLMVIGFSPLELVWYRFNSILRVLRESSTCAFVSVAFCDTYDVTCTNKISVYARC